MGWDFLESYSPNPITNSESKNPDFHEFRIRISLFVIAVFVKNIQIGMNNLCKFMIHSWFQNCLLDDTPTILEIIYIYFLSIKLAHDYKKSGKDIVKGI